MYQYMYLMYMKYSSDNTHLQWYLLCICFSYFRFDVTLDGEEQVQLYVAQWSARKPFAFSILRQQLARPSCAIN